MRENEKITKKNKIKEMKYWITGRKKNKREEK